MIQPFKHQKERQNAYYNFYKKLFEFFGLENVEEKLLQYPTENQQGHSDVNHTAAGH